MRVGELKETTGAVESVMARARRAAQQVFYFVGQAYPHNAGRLDQYGRRAYGVARNSHKLMQALLQTALDSATRDQATLAAQGCGAA